MEMDDIRSRKTIIIFMYVSIIVASFIFTLPIIVLTVNGPVQPGDIYWKMNDNGEKVPVMRDEADDKSKTFIRVWNEKFKNFYDKLGLPIRPNSTSIFLIGIILGAIYILLAERVFSDEYKFVTKATAAAFKAQLSMWLLCILVVIYHLIFSEYPEYLRNAIDDKILAEAAVSNYYSRSIAHFFLPLIFFIIFDFLSCIIYMFADFIIPYRFRKGS